MTLYYARRHTPYVRRYALINYRTVIALGPGRSAYWRQSEHVTDDITATGL